MLGRRFRCVTFVWVLVLATTTAGLGGVTTAAAPPAVDTAPAVSAVQSTNNTTTPHRNPAEYTAEGDRQALQNWLAGRMGEVLIDCSEHTAARQFNACAVDREYPEWASNYVELAAETDTARDDEAARAFERAGNNQQTFTDETQQFWETYEAYQEAREQGNEDRTRQLARRLNQQATSINRTGAALIQDYDQVETTTSADLSAAEENVNQTRRNTTALATEVEQNTLLRTNLTVSGNATHASFRQPLRISGQLTTANGTALTNRSVQFRIAEQTFQTNTDSDGQFEVLYRPTRVPLTTEELGVQYQPQTSSRYRAATASLPITITQVTVPVTVTQKPNETRFGETTVVAGQIATPEANASGVPTQVSFANTVQTRTTTNATGAYRTAFQVPATIRPGAHPVTIALADGRALNGSTTTTITVTPAASKLTITATQQDTNRVQIEGQLTTTDGTPVPSQPIQLSLNGTTTTTTRTNAEGQYTAVVRVPDRATDASANQTVELAARFDGDGTNLDPAENATTARLLAPGNTVSVGDQIAAETQRFIDSVGLFGLLALIGLICSVGWIVYRRTGLQRVLGPISTTITERYWLNTEAPSESTADPNAENTNSSTVATTSASPYDDAQQRLEAGDPDEAVRMAYALTRERLSDIADVNQAATHREFLSATHEMISGDGADLLAHLTDIYERATYADQHVSEEAAKDAIDAAEQLHTQPVVRADGKETLRPTQSDTKPSQ